MLVFKMLTQTFLHRWGLDPHWSSFDEQANVNSLASSLRRLWLERGDKNAALRLVARH